MSTKNETDILEGLERLTKLSGLIKGLLWFAGIVGTTIVGVAGWVWTINADLHKAGISAAQANARIDQEVGPRISVIESWKYSYEAEKFTAKEAFAIDKRLQRVEDQNAVILDQLKKIDAKL